MMEYFKVQMVLSLILMLSLPVILSYGIVADKNCTWLLVTISAAAAWGSINAFAWLWIDSQEEQSND